MLSLILIIVLVPITGYYFYRQGGDDTRLSGILLAAFLLRLFLMVADLGHWFPIPNSGQDTQTFHEIALNNVLNHRDEMLTNYTKFLTIFYYIFGPERALAQFVNVLMGMGVLVCLLKAMDLCDVRSNIRVAALAILAFMPNMIILSSILLREAWVQFAVALSLVYFVRWYFFGRLIDMLLALICCLVGAYMHSGVLGIMAGYLIAGIVFNPQTRSIHFGFANIALIAVVAVGLYFAADYADLFTGKFQSADLETDEGRIEMMNMVASGESGYLQWLPETDNFAEGLAFAPLRMLYFFFSPLPTDWNRIVDVAGFLIDSLFYIYMFWIICARHPIWFNRNLKKFLIISILLFGFIFGYGTRNAGTAFRHRAKGITLIALAYSISESRHKEETEKVYEIQ